MNESTGQSVETAAFKPFTGTAQEYSQALHRHHLDCAICAPSGLPNTNDGPLCGTGRRLRRGLSYARGRAAGQTGAYL